MKTYRVIRDSEENVLSRREEGVYDIGIEELIYIDEKGRSYLTHIQQGFDTAHKIERTDIYKKYGVNHAKGGYMVEELGIFETPEIAELTLSNREVTLKDIETGELLDPYDYGIFATGMTVNRPAKKHFKEKNYLEDLLDHIR